MAQIIDFQKYKLLKTKIEYLRSKGIMTELELAQYKRDYECYIFLESQYNS